jgi:hypothetical protein
MNLAGLNENPKFQNLDHEVFTFLQNHLVFDSAEHCHTQLDKELNEAQKKYEQY